MSLEMKCTNIDGCQQNAFHLFVVSKMHFTILLSAKCISPFCWQPSMFEAMCRVQCWRPGLILTHATSFVQISRNVVHCRYIKRYLSYCRTAQSHQSLCGSDTHYIELEEATKNRKSGPTSPTQPFHTPSKVAIFIELVSLEILVLRMLLCSGCLLPGWTPYFKLTASSEFGTYRLCEQRRLRRACASVQSRQNLRRSLIQAVSQEEPSDRKPDPWPLWMAGHAQLKLVMTECSKTQIRLTGLKWPRSGLHFTCVFALILVFDQIL